jgi:hypothetical protein
MILYEVNAIEETAVTNMAEFFSSNTWEEISEKLHCRQVAGALGFQIFSKGCESAPVHLSTEEIRKPSKGIFWLGPTVAHSPVLLLQNPSLPLCPYRNKNSCTKLGLVT